MLLTSAETRYANIEHEMLAVVLSFITTYMVDHLYVLWSVLAMTQFTRLNIKQNNSIDSC